ncbi:MAG: DUF6391 domain-containing protein [Phormidesmis sp. CAN_BIN44]|nr:DUF6391 domain-containing protein [Phormidesmis sp. CAN_BIN44]
MTTADYEANSNSWSAAFPAPQPTQDTDLLRQIGFIPRLKEVLMLRQVHRLEHATVWVLSGAAHTSIPGDNRSQASIDSGGLGGLSTEQGFYLYGQVKTSDVSRAVSEALRRIKSEWNLAVHPRCGTNLSVEVLLTAGLAWGAFALLPKGAIEQLLGFGVAATAAAQLTPELGRVVQQYVMTAIPFNLEVQDISAVQDAWSRPAHFVRVQWIE